MRTMLNLFSRLAADTSGATAIEYGLIATLVSITVGIALGDNVTDIFTKISNALDAVP